LLTWSHPSAQAASSTSQAWAGTAGTASASSPTSRTRRFPDRSHGGIARLGPEALGDKELLADLVKSQTSSGLAGVVRLMSTIRSLTVDAEELDADPWLLNTPTDASRQR